MVPGCIAVRLRQYRRRLRVEGQPAAGGGGRRSSGGSPRCCHSAASSTPPRDQLPTSGRRARCRSAHRGVRRAAGGSIRRGPTRWAASGCGRIAPKAYSAGVTSSHWPMAALDASCGECVTTPRDLRERPRRRSGCVPLKDLGKAAHRRPHTHHRHRRRRRSRQPP